MLRQQIRETSSRVAARQVGAKFPKLYFYDPKSRTDRGKQILKTLAILRDYTRDKVFEQQLKILIILIIIPSDNQKKQKNPVI